MLHNAPESLTNKRNLTSTIRNGISALFIRYWQPLAIFAASRVIMLLLLAMLSVYGFGEARLDRWDARSYLSIATYGYQFHGSYLEEGSFIAFFPFYPLVVRLVSEATHIPIPAAAFGVAVISAAVAGCLLYEYALVNSLSRTEALTASALLSFFPASVFLSSPYTEGTFLVLAIGCLLAMRKDRLGAASVLAGLAMITRLTGIVLAPLLLWQLWRHRRSWFASLLSLVAMALPLLAFLVFQWRVYGTPLAFMVAQRVNWQEHIIWPWQGIWNVFQNAFSSPSNTTGMWWGQAAVLVVTIMILVKSYRKVPDEAFVFGWGVFLLSVSQSYIMAAPRYMMAVLPYYLFVARLSRRSLVASYVIMSVSISWMVLNTVLFSLSKYFF